MALRYHLLSAHLTFEQRSELSPHSLLISSCHQWVLKGTQEGKSNSLCLARKASRDVTPHQLLQDLSSPPLLLPAQDSETKTPSWVRAPKHGQGQGLGQEGGRVPGSGALLLLFRFPESQTNHLYTVWHLKGFTFILRGFIF